MDFQTALQALGLAEAPDRDRLDRTYAELVKRYRPDRDPARFREIREAYETLRGSLPGSPGSSVPPEEGRSPSRPELADRLHAILKKHGFGAFKEEWEEWRAQASNSSETRDLTLLALGLAFFDADPAWRRARLRDLSLEVPEDGSSGILVEIA